MIDLRIDLRRGRWQEALAGVGVVSAVICDPPYSAKTHETQAASTARVMPDGADRRTINYACWTPADVREFVEFWSPRCSGWMATMTDSELVPAWQQAYRDVGRLTFAPVVIIQDRVRLSGDGPASCAVYLVVARPRSQEFQRWGALPGWYRAGTERDGHIGGKPLSLMHRLIVDYSRPGDIVCDPCAGYGTTLVAAYDHGRQSIGSECDLETYLKAKERVDLALRQLSLFAPAPKPEQSKLF